MHGAAAGTQQPLSTTRTRPTQSVAGRDLALRSLGWAPRASQTRVIVLTMRRTQATLVAVATTTTLFPSSSHAANFSTGSPSCPCLDFANATRYNSTGLSVVISGSVYAYPYDYGSTYCAPHDSGLAPFCKDDEASFCGESWCYVNAEKCHRSAITYIVSDYSMADEGSKLYYSYETCGGNTSLFSNHYGERWEDPVREARAPSSRSQHHPPLCCFQKPKSTT